MTREQDQITGLLSGVDEYLTKPFKPSALNASIERVLRLTPADRQRRMDYLVQTQADQE
jgi:DNA-binding response OmpR family regulator